MIGASYNIDREDEHLPVNMQTLTPRMKHIAKVELGETEEKVQNGLLELRAVVEDLGIVGLFGDKFLLAYLRSRKFRIKDAKECLRMIMKKREDIMRGIDTQNYGLRAALSHKICGILPYRDIKGRVIMFLRANVWDNEICDSDDILATMRVICFYALQYPATATCGFNFIVDISDLSSNMFSLLVNHFLQSSMLVKGLPARVQGIHILCNSMLIRVLINGAQSLFPKKFFGRIHAHMKDSDTLFKHFSRSILPQEFGGTLDPQRMLSCSDGIEATLEHLSIANAKIGRDIY